MKQDFAEILITMPFCLGYLWAAGKFCKKILGTSRIKAILFPILLFIGFSLINAVAERFSLPNIFFTLPNHIFLIGLTMLLFEAATEQKILAASMLIAATTLLGIFCSSFFSCLTLLWMHTVEKIPVPFIGEWGGRLISCICLAAETAAVCRMPRCLASVFYEKPRKWYALLSVPLLTVTTVIDVAAWGASNGVLVRSGGNMGLYYDQLFSHAGFCVLTALSMFAAGFYLFGMDRIYLEQQKSGRYHSQIAAYKILEEQYSQAERLRHDMKNHLIALSGLLEEKEWEKMGTYLGDMMDNGSLGGGEATGNKVVDALLYQKQKTAENENILWECDVQIPRTCCINEFDLCVLFGNILDNAIEACERLESKNPPCSPRRFINIQAKAVKSCFLLEAKNSADTTGSVETKTAKPKRPKGRGIGLLNIKDIVSKYDGAMNIEMQNGIFTISILMPLKDAAHDIQQAV